MRLEFAIQTVGKGHGWQMKAEPRFVNRAAVLDWTGKRSRWQAADGLPSGFQLLTERCG